MGVIQLLLRITRTKQLMMQEIVLLTKHFFSFLNPNGVIRIEGSQNTKLLVSTSTFLSCSNSNTSSKHGGCIYLNQGQCISYQVCSSKCSTLNEGSYCKTVVSDSSSKNYILLSSIHSGNSQYNSFYFRNGDVLVSLVNDTNNIANYNPAFYIEQSDYFCINYSYFNGNKATSGEVIFRFYSYSPSESYSCVFLNNLNVDLGSGIFGLYFVGNYTFKECIIKSNQHKNLFYSGSSSIYIYVINCLIEENICSVTLSGDAQTQFEITTNLPIKLSLYSTEECPIEEGANDNNGCDNQFQVCNQEKTADRPNSGMRPNIYCIFISLRK